MDINLEWLIKKAFILILALGGMVTFAVLMREVLISNRAATALVYQHPEAKLINMAVQAAAQAAAMRNECQDKVVDLSEHDDLSCTPGATIEVVDHPAYRQNGKATGVLLCHCNKPDTNTGAK